MDKFTLALSTIKMNKQFGFIFEKAYCSYRLGKFISALNLLESTEKLDSKSKLLKGQIFYRLERFEEASTIFEHLIESEEFPIEELQINLSAARSQLAFKNSPSSQELSQVPPVEPSFDSVYNMAIYKLASKEFKEAEQLAFECCEKFSSDENVSQSDLINAKLVAICAGMNDKNNWPESEFLLRKLKASIGYNFVLTVFFSIFILFSLTPIQDTLISANLMAILDGSNSNFNIKNMEKLSLFNSQKLQILANAHNSGIKLENSQVKSISKPLIVSNTINIYDFKCLKKDITNADNKGMKIECVVPGLDKERWLPLRDRSYYKPKAQYLKSKSLKVSKK